MDRMNAPGNSWQCRFFAGRNPVNPVLSRSSLLTFCGESPRICALRRLCVSRSPRISEFAPPWFTQAGSSVAALPLWGPVVP